MSTNFSFLADEFPALEKIGSLAEDYLYSDPNSCLYKLGVLSETIVNYMFELDKIALPETDDTLANKVKILKLEGMLPRDISDILYVLRIKRNKAAYQAYDSLEDCKTMLMALTSPV